jgi:hypothetical protein
MPCITTLSKLSSHQWTISNQATRWEEDAHVIDCMRGRQGDGGEGDIGRVANRQSGGWSESTARPAASRIDIAEDGEANWRHESTVGRSESWAELQIEEGHGWGAAEGGRAWACGSATSEKESWRLSRNISFMYCFHRLGPAANFINITRPPCYYST